MLKNLKLSSKIIFLVSSLIIISSLIYLLVVFFETNQVKKSMVEEFKKVALNETTTITRDVYEMCKVYNNGLQRRLNGSMQMLDALIKQQGGLTLSSTEKVDWNAINQLNQASTNVSLPQMQLGSKWLGNSNSFSTQTPVIDEVSSAFGVTCTVFQKMDDQGSLLRVASTVKTTNGDRAIGTYIPAVNMNGSSNAVAAAINRGEVYKGVALVVGRWCSTVYVPIKDGNGKVIGAIYVGIDQDDDPAIRKAIMDIVVGKTGYVFVIGADGTREQANSRLGRYIISLKKNNNYEGVADGNDLWEIKDPISGKYIIQEMLKLAKDSKRGEIVSYPYNWQNQGDKAPRLKQAAVLYFEPFGWLIGASTYEDDYNAAEIMISKSIMEIMIYLIITIIIVLVVGGIVSYLTAKSIAKPLVRAVDVASAISNGDFSQSINVNTRDEIGVLAQAIDNVPATLNMMSEQFNHLSKAAEAGDLTFRGEADKFNGEYKSIIGVVNTTLDNISKPINDSMKVLDKLQNNDTSMEVNENGLKGDYLKIAQSVNNVRNRINHVQSILVNVSQGNLNDLDELKKQGKRSKNDKLVPAFITMMQAINLLIEDANTLAQAGQKGKLSVRADASVHHGAYRDIVEGVNNILDSVVTPLNEAATVLRAAADKDLSKNFTSHCEGDFENLKNDINGLIDSMNNALGQVGEAVQQVTAGGDQIAEASQSLSQGATEQAASLEEISSSMTQIGSQINTNAENANNASKLAHSAKLAAQTGGKNMEEMVGAMKDISSSSEQIAKVNKVIDDIAFQTNLLALNAAVEAARAGVHGKGFAVVAGEVRNLASRSAKAAQETAEIIEESLHKVKNGLAVAGSTQETFKTILDGITKVTDLSGEIAAASSEQAQGISQINQGLTQIDQVTQQNTAHAEETAAASEELSGQANQLQSLIRQFNLKHNLAEVNRPQSRPQKSFGGSRPAGGARMVQMTNSPNKKVSPNMHNDNWGKGAGNIKPEELISFDDDDFGKF